MDQKKEFLFFFFLFLFVFAIYRLYFLPIDRDRYLVKEVDQKRHLPSSYRFLIFFPIVIVGIFLVIAYYLFKKARVKKEEVILKDEQLFAGDRDFDRNEIDGILGGERNVISRNNNLVYSDSKILDSIVLDRDLINHATKLKKGETVVLTDRKIFQKNDGNHLKYFSDREINFFDCFLLTDEKRRNIRFFLASEIEFIRCFLLLFLRINNYFFHLQEHDKKKDGFFYLCYYHVKNLRAEEKNVQSDISSLWKKTEEARKKQQKLLKILRLK